MFHLSKESCESCQDCCFSTPSILLFPEEVPRINHLAELLKLKVVLHLQDVIFDKKNEDVLVIRYAMIRDEQGKCPFFDETAKSCAIFDTRPFWCRMYPLTMELVDSEHTQISILGKCSETHHFESIDLLWQEFPDKMERLQAYFDRLQTGMTYIGQLNELEEIEMDITQELPAEEFQHRVSTWNHVEVKPPEDSETSE